MPRVGVPNNPSGANSWEGFGTEEPYGQKTREASLGQAAPLAGAAVASGPIAAPKRAARQARRGATAQPASVAPAAPQPMNPPVISADAQLAQRWQAIAAIPGSSPLVQEYAQLAMQRAANG